MRFGVLGPLAVWTDDGTPVTVPGTKVRALLADLLVHRGSVVTADQLVEDLWGSDPPAKPLGALQAKVSQLRRALDTAEAGARDLVVSRGPGYALDVPAGAVDAGRFAEVADGARDRPADRLAEALRLWRGPALADVADSAFARAAVAELEEQWLVVTEAHLEARSAVGEDAAVIAELTTLVARHPLREGLHAALMRALYRAGRQAEALRRYDELRATLADELGVDPSPELADLHGAILRHELGGGGRPEDPPAGDGAGNLPAAWDEIVGRDEEVAALRAALGAARLVTVVGPGGVGKTRLALEAARGMAGDAPDGAWLVDLTCVDTTADTTADTAADPAGSAVAAVAAVADAVADTLGLRDDAPVGNPTGGAVPPERSAQVAEALSRRRLVLVLDNCEHVVDAAAELVVLLLRRAPELRVLATSREPLDVRGEHLRPVGPLGLPDPDGDPAASPAVRLFVARATEADPGFTLTDATAGAVVAICSRLDGLPLALELAAARVRTLGLREVATRLDDRFALLDRGPRDAPARQRTLRAVMGWSWEPLSAAERAVLRRLAATAGDADVELVEAVCDGEPVPPGSVQSHLARLVDRSLVVAAEAGGRTRWRMLETVAAYAGERLAEAGEANRVRLRHAESCAELVERAAPRLRGRDQAAWLARLDRESANVRVALDTAVAAGDGALALRIVVAASWYWYLRGRRSTARRSLSRALEIGGKRSVARADATCAHAAIVARERGTDDPITVARTALAEYDGLDAPVALARAQLVLVDALGRIGDLSFSEELAAAALRTFRAGGDRWGVAAALAEQGVNDVMRGRLDSARRAATEAGELFDGIGDRWGQARAAELLGHLDEIAGGYAAATRRHRVGLSHAEGLQLWPSVIAHHNRLGRLALLGGAHDGADDHHRRALTLAQDRGHGPAATFARLGLAMTARRRGHLDEAGEHLAAVRGAPGGTAHVPETAITFAEAGFLAEQRGDADTAREEHLTGLRIARRAGDARAVALGLEGLAGAAALSGDHGRAARLLGAAETARDSVGSPLPSAERGDVDRITDVTAAALGPDAFAAALDRGRAAGPDESG